MSFSIVCLTSAACAIAVLRLSPTARAWLFAFLWKHGCTALADAALRDTKRALVREANLSGRVLDVGSGSGTQVSYLCGAGAPNVRELVCVEPNVFFHKQLREAIRAAEESASAAGVKVRITMYGGTLAQYCASSETPSGSFDAVSCLLVLCSVPDVDAALAECAQLLKPRTGKLVFLEHVAAAGGCGRAVQRGLQPLWDLVGDGCQLCRDTAGAIDRVGARTGRWRRNLALQARLSPRRGAMPTICGVCEPCGGQ